MKFVFFIISIIFLFISCDKSRNIVWKQEIASEPFLDRYTEFHFTKKDRGKIRSIGDFDDKDFVINENKAYFFNDTFEITRLSKNFILIKNDYYYAEFKEVENNNFTNQNKDSLFQVNRVLYLIKNLDPKNKSIFAEDYLDDLIDLLNGNFFDRDEIDI
ncbi:MAG: hypothetical protein P1U56_16940 [Saprospiraceae bacterium]|nr:hypothetical protein [Saprospiraceae bacterium]